MTEADFLAIQKARQCPASGRWDSHEIKEELALPCFNRANAVVVAEVTKKHKAVRSQTGPATENLAYVEPGSSEPFDYMPKTMEGGGYQLTPDGTHLNYIGEQKVPMAKPRMNFINP